MNITVYLGASTGNDPALPAAVAELGSWIGKSGNRLVFGGSKTGLMGVLAHSVIDAGGPVTGVEAKFFYDQNVQCDFLTELIVSDTIPERKSKMIELGDAFIAFPGGTGTLDELSDILMNLAIGALDAPCILYNLNGYYNGLKAFLDKMVETGLSTREKLKQVYFAENLDEIVSILNAK